MIIKSGEFVKRGGWWVVAQFALFGLILLALTKNTDTSAPWLWAGWALIATALALGGSALFMLRDKLTAMPAPVDGAVLHRRGPFALVRHPIYTAVIFGFVGLAIKGGNPIALAAALVLIPFFLAKTSHEERLLADRFPEYVDYQRQVRHRIVPWLL